MESRLKLQPHGLVQQWRCRGHSGSCRNHLRRYDSRHDQFLSYREWCALRRMAWCSQLLGSKPI